MKRILGSIENRIVTIQPSSCVEQKKSKSTQATTNSRTKRAHEATCTTSYIGFGYLPPELLFKILDKLLLVDLSKVEIVCKHWRNVAHLVWSRKKSIRLDRANMFCYSSGFIKSKNDPMLLDNLLRARPIGDALIELDLSEYLSMFCLYNKKHHRVVKPLSLLALAKQCPNLENLNLKKTNVCNQSLVEVANNCHKLRSLVLTECWQIKEESLGAILEQCPLLEQLDLHGCAQISGKCFMKVATTSLRRLQLDTRYQPCKLGITHLLKSNPLITHLGIICYEFDPDLFSAVGKNIFELKITLHNLISGYSAVMVCGPIDKSSRAVT